MKKMVFRENFARWGPFFVFPRDFGRSLDPWKFPAQTVCCSSWRLPKGSSIVAHTEEVCFDASSRVQRAACNLQMRWPSRVSTIPSCSACNDVAPFIEPPLFFAATFFHPCRMNFSKLFQRRLCVWKSRKRRSRIFVATPILLLLLHGQEQREEERKCLVTKIVILDFS